MTIIDDISTVVEDCSSGQAGTVTVHQERIAFLNGKLEAQHDFFREQIAELKSSLTQTEQENLNLKVNLEQVMREKEELEAQATSSKAFIATVEWSIVSFHLDLTGRGTLNVSVDDKPMVQVFTGMKKGNNESFIPAVYLYNESRIEFLSLQQK